MRIACAGGGPGGLYAALLLKKADPEREITVYDRNPLEATYGWGVVFSDETLSFLAEADPESHARITHEFVHWQAIDIYYRDELIRSGGHAFSGLSRRRLLAILQDRCRELGVELRYRQEIKSVASLQEASLIIAADGLNSLLRESRHEAFEPHIDIHPTRFIWLGARIQLDAFTFIFRQTPHGMFQVHAYPFEPEMSTFIVECNESTWRRAGLDRASEGESVSFCQELFSDFLAGHELLSNRSSWINFVTLRNTNWYDRNLVLLGDAAHTAHFSIGSGTKIAMEDAIALSAAMDSRRDLAAALLEYEELRQPVVERTQQAARDSSLWFEHAERYARFDNIQFAFSLLTRSKRITYENLAIRDPAFARQVDTWFAGRGCREGVANAPPLATGLKIAGRETVNRLARMPALPDDAVEGVPGAGTACNLLAAAAELPGLLIARDVAVSPDGRISRGSAGLYSEAHTLSWREIVDAAHGTGPVLVSVQLGHAGPRGAVRPRIEGVDLPLEGQWPLLAASCLAYSPFSRTPRDVDVADMSALRQQFVAAAGRALAAGFDVLELDFSHGYLLATFLSPLTNRRDDDFGGSPENRLRFPRDVVTAVRACWPADRPLSASFSPADWARGGITLEEAVTIARSFCDAGCDLIHVVSGQTTFQANPPYGRTWEVGLADAIRNEARVKVLAGGAIRTADEANTILAAGRADMCLISTSINFAVS